MSVRIEIVHGTDSERATAAHLAALLERYDTTPWEFTDVVRIDDGVIPHSHPVLTINTRSRDDLDLLSTYLHEQLHWFMPASVDGENEMVRRYPDIEATQYVHVHVCWLELDALAGLVSRDEAKAALLRKPYYQDMYKLVVDDDESLGELFRSHGMVPRPRNLDYTILVVDDLDRAINFYEQVVGFPLQHRSGPYAQFATGTTRFALYERSAMAETLGLDEPPRFEIGCKVRDVDAAYTELVTGGAEPAVEPTDRPWGQRTAYVRDPDGHYVELAQDL